MRRLSLVWSDHVTRWLLPPYRGPLNTQPCSGICAVLFLGIWRADPQLLPVIPTGHFKLIPLNFTGIGHNFWHFSSQSQLCLLNLSLILKLFYISLMCERKPLKGCWKYVGFLELRFSQFVLALEKKRLLNPEFCSSQHPLCSYETQFSFVWCPQKQHNFSHDDLSTGALMILNEPGEFSQNTNEQNPAKELSGGLEYHEC